MLVTPMVQSFKYLRVQFKDTGINCKSHIAKVLSNAKTAVHFFGHLRYNGTDPPPKLTIFKSFVRK